MTEPKSVLDRDLLKRAAANLEAEAQLYMARAKLWSQGGKELRTRENDDAKAYERWAELHRAARRLLEVASSASLTLLLAECL